MGRQIDLGEFGQDRESRQTQQILAGGQKQIQDIAKEELDYGMQVAVQEQIAAFSGEELRLKEELNKVKGKDAIEASEKTLKQFDKFYEKQDSGIGNPIVKRATRLKYQQYRDSLSKYAIPYANAEVRRFDDRTFAAVISNAQKLAWTDPLNVGAFSDSMKAQVDAIEHYADRNGLPQEEKAAMLSAARSTTNMGTMDALYARGLNSAGKAFYEANRDGFYGEDRTRAEKIVAEGSLRSEAYRVVDGLYAKGATFGEAQDEIRKIEDTDLRRMSMNLLEERDREVDAAKKKQMDDIYERAYKVFDSNPRIPPREAIPSNEWALLDSSYQKALNQTWSNLNKKSEGEQTDWAVHGVMCSLGREALQKMTLADVLKTARPYMSDTIYGEFFKKWQDAHDPMKAQKFQSDFSRDQMYMKTLAGAKIAGITEADLPNMSESLKKSDDKARAFGLFKEAVDVKRRDFHAATGKDPDDNATQAIASQIAFNWGQTLPAQLEGSTLFHPLSVEFALGRKSPQLYKFIESPESVKDFLFYMEPAEVDAFYNVSKSIPGLIPATMDRNQFLRDKKDQIRLAYLAYKNGGTNEQIANILSGK